jgi:hypothetical protein
MFTFRARAVIVQMTKDIVLCSLSVCTQLFHHLRKTKAVAKGGPSAMFGCYSNLSPKSRACWVLSTHAFRACTVIALSVYMTKDIVSCSHSARAQLLYR